jgi:uncharacterized membrane protein YeaQ/YmgE (transglycosylase-associated protein family)
MSVRTGGEIRGVIARWLMRFEAAGNILRMVFLGVTAASTLTSALALIGYEQFAPIVLSIGLLGTAVFAFAYTEFGIYNRKNRERADVGTNWAGPGMRMDDELIGAAVFAAVHGRPPDTGEQEAISEAVDKPWREFRDGIEVDG